MTENNFFAMLISVLVICWGAMVSWRVVHTRARRCLLSVAGLMLFWIILRILKWEVVEDPNARRQLWYLYYLPMLMIPMLCLDIALFLGKSESYKLPLFLKALFGLTGLFVLFVMTNDFHEMVFSFPADVLIRTDEAYSYEPGYYVVLGLALCCAATALLVMIQKTRTFRNKWVLLLPILSLGFLVIYCVLYISHVIGKLFFLHDLTMVFCVCVMTALEGCIQSGLIPSNTHYAELFQLSTIDGQITDRNFRVLLTANCSGPLSEDMVQRVAASSGEGDGRPCRVAEQSGEEGGESYIRLVSAPLKQGYVLWREDISEISEIIAELADKSEYLTARKEVLQKEVETGRREQQLVEKNRLYYALIDGMKEEIDYYDNLLSRIEESDDPVELPKLTKRLAVICTHIKRRSNLIFLAEENQQIEAAELRYALEEWFSDLRMAGVVCGSIFDMQGQIVLPDMLFLYDSFQEILSYALDSLESLFVNCHEREGRPVLLVTLACGEDFGGFDAPGVTVSDADGAEWVLEVDMRTAGGDGA